MADNPITEDMIREAGFAARSGASGPSVSAQDFSFGSTMFDSAHGNADGASVSGVGAGISDIAVEQIARLDVENRKKDDPASDAALIVEVADRVRKELIRIGQLTVSRAELVAFSQAMQDPEFRAQYEQSLRDKGVPENEISDRMAEVQELAELAIKVADDNASDAEKARYDELEANAQVIDNLDSGLELAEKSKSVTADLSEAASPKTSEESNFLTSMQSDSNVMAAPDRQGSSLADIYNEKAIGSPNNDPVNSVSDVPTQALKFEV